MKLRLKCEISRFRGERQSAQTPPSRVGGNAYHGSLFEFVRNDAFDATPYAFTAVHLVKSPFKWNDYGYEIDGPIVIPKVFNGRNKLFFMSNYEWLVQRQHSLSTRLQDAPGDSILVALAKPLQPPIRFCQTHVDLLVAWARLFSDDRFFQEVKRRPWDVKDMHGKSCFWLRG
ncbi:MAG: TonB-dependent receptor [Bryobacterales bacterium]|nr:TonB-dependent receptor [Bryobacterales bacterium]